MRSSIAASSFEYVASQREAQVLALMLGLQWYDQMLEHACNPSTMALRAPMAVEGRGADYWHERRFGASGSKKGHSKHSMHLEGHLHAHDNFMRCLKTSGW